MSAPPKKFTDGSRSVITDEWREWYDAQALDRKDDLMDMVAARGYDVDAYWPEEAGKHVGDGAWIIVVEEPHTEIKARFSVPTPSLWYGRPAAGGSRLTYGTGMNALTTPPAYKVTIETPGGTLWLYPHEYVVCNDPLPLITDPECTIHPLGGRVAVDEEHLFYLMARGITAQDATLMLLDGLDASDWGWVEFPEYARAAYEGVGRKLRIA